MSAENNFLVLGLDGTVISSGGDLQSDERFVLESGSEGCRLLKTLFFFQECSHHLPAGEDCEPGRLEGAEDHGELRRPRLHHLLLGEENSRRQETRRCPRNCCLDQSFFKFQDGEKYGL